MPLGNLELEVGGGTRVRSPILLARRVLTAYLTVFSRSRSHSDSTHSGQSYSSSHLQERQRFEHRARPSPPNLLSMLTLGRLEQGCCLASVEVEADLPIGRYDLQVASFCLYPHAYLRLHLHRFEPEPAS